MKTIEDKISLSVSKMEELLKNNSEDLLIYIDKLLQDNTEESLIVEGYFYKSRYYLEIHDYAESQKFADKANDIFLKNKDDIGLMKSYNHLALLYFNQSDFNKSAEYLNKAIVEAEILEDYNKVNAFKSNLARIYNELKQDEKAVSLLSEVLDFLSKDKNIKYYSVLNNLIITIRNNNFEYNYQKYLKELKEGITSIKLDLDSVLLYLTTAKYLIENNELNEAENLLYTVGSSVKLNEFSSNRLIYVSTYIDLIFAKKEWGLLKRYIDIHYEITKKIQTYELRLITIKYYTDYYKAIGDFEKALEWKEKYYELYSENMNFQRIKSVNEAIQKYEVERKEAEAVIYKLKNVQMKDLNNQLKDKNDQLRLVNQELEETIITKDKMYSIITHDLKNPLGAIFSSTDLINFYLNNNDYDEVKKLVGLIKNSSNQMQEILAKFLDWFRSKQNNVSVEPELLCLNDVVVLSIKLVELIIIQKNIHIEFNNERKFLVHFDLEMLKVIIRNIISNAIKFSNSDSKILIEISEDEMVKLSITDYGVGLDDKSINTIMNTNKIISKTGTNNEKGTGLGLQIVKKFIHLNKGKIDVESEPGKGTSFHLFFPKFE